MCIVWKWIAECMIIGVSDDNGDDINFAVIDSFWQWFSLRKWSDYLIDQELVYNFMGFLWQPSQLHSSSSSWFGNWICHFGYWHEENEHLHKIHYSKKKKTRPSARFRSNCLPKVIRPICKFMSIVNNWWADIEFASKENRINMRQNVRLPFLMNLFADVNNDKNLFNMFGAHWDYSNAN